MIPWVPGRRPSRRPKRGAGGGRYGLPSRARLIRFGFRLPNDETDLCCGVPIVRDLSNWPNGGFCGSEKRTIAVTT